MSRRIILTTDARANLKSSSEWYRRIDVDLSLRFEQNVRVTLLRIARFPHAFSYIDFHVRRARMDRFPYYIYFSVSANYVLIRAISHQRRDEAAWMKRRDGNDDD